MACVRAAAIVAALAASLTASLAGVLALAASQDPELSTLPMLAGREAARFHHLHLVTGSAVYIADFYARLFVPRAIVRGSFWEIEGVRGDGVFLLVSPPQGASRSGGHEAIWHFGWGKISVGETYQEHLINEVNWQPPYPQLTTDMHVHLRSRDPLAAARWYEAVLGAAREETLPAAAGGPSPPGSAVHRDEGRAEAIVGFENMRFIIHRTGLELASSRDAGSVDHLSFLVPEAKTIAARAREAGIATVGLRYALTDVPAVMIEGPDRTILELIERPKGPAFWLDPPRPAKTPGPPDPPDAPDRPGRPDPLDRPDPPAAPERR